MAQATGEDAWLATLIGKYVLIYMAGQIEQNNQGSRVYDVRLDAIYPTALLVMEGANTRYLIFRHAIASIRAK